MITVRHVSYTDRAKQDHVLSLDRHILIDMRQLTGEVERLEEAKALVEAVVKEVKTSHQADYPKTVENFLTLLERTLKLGDKISDWELLASDAVMKSFMDLISSLQEKSFRRFEADHAVFAILTHKYENEGSIGEDKIKRDYERDISFLELLCDCLDRDDLIALSAAVNENRVHEIMKIFASMKRTARAARAEREPIRLFHRQERYLVREGVHIRAEGEQIEEYIDHIRDLLAHVSDGIDYDELVHTAQIFAEDFQTLCALMVHYYEGKSWEHTFTFHKRIAVIVAAREIESVLEKARDIHPDGIDYVDRIKHLLDGEHKVMIQNYQNVRRESKFMGEVGDEVDSLHEYTEAQFEERMQRFIDAYDHFWNKDGVVLRVRSVLCEELRRKDHRSMDPKISAECTVSDLFTEQNAGSDEGLFQIESLQKIPQPPETRFEKTKIATVKDRFAVQVNHWLEANNFSWIRNHDRHYRISNSEQRDTDGQNHTERVLVGKEQFLDVRVEVVDGKVQLWVDLDMDKGELFVEEAYRDHEMPHS